MSAWMQADEYAVEWALNEAAYDARPPARPLAPPKPKPKPTHTPAQMRATKQRPKAAADDYYAQRAREECARLREMFLHNTYRQDTARILADAKRRAAEWEREKAA